MQSLVRLKHVNISHVLNSVNLNDKIDVKLLAVGEYLFAN